MKKRDKTITPSYSPCKKNHHMIYNAPELLLLLNVFHLPNLKESKESILLGNSLDKAIANQHAQIADHHLKIQKAQNHIQQLRDQSYWYQSQGKG